MNKSIVVFFSAKKNLGKRNIDKLKNYHIFQKYCQKLNDTHYSFLDLFFQKTQLLNFQNQMVILINLFSPLKSLCAYSYRVFLLPFHSKVIFSNPCNPKKCVNGVPASVANW